MVFRKAALPPRQRNHRERARRSYVGVARRLDDETFCRASAADRPPRFTIGWRRRGLDGLMARSFKQIVDDADNAPPKRKRAGRVSLKAEKLPDAEDAKPKKGEEIKDDFLKTALDRVEQAYQREK